MIVPLGPDKTERFDRKYFVRKHLEWHADRLWPLKGATTFSITRLSIKTLSIKAWYVTLILNDTQR